MICNINSQRAKKKLHCSNQISQPSIFQKSWTPGFWRIHISQNWMFSVQENHNCINIISTYLTWCLNFFDLPFPDQAKIMSHVLLSYKINLFGEVQVWQSVQACHFIMINQASPLGLCLPWCLNQLRSSKLKILNEIVENKNMLEEIASVFEEWNLTYIFEIPLFWILSEKHQSIHTSFWHQLYFWNFTHLGL